MITIRRAEPGDAEALVELAGDVGGEEGAWLLTTTEWRSITEERRYLRAVRRHPDAAVYLAEDGDDVVGRRAHRGEGVEIGAESIGVDAKQHGGDASPDRPVSHS